jgi:hypothetical protein
MATTTDSRSHTTNMRRSLKLDPTFSYAADKFTLISDGGGVQMC